MKYFILLLISFGVEATDEPFNVTMKLLAPIVITEVSPLTFPNSPRGTAVNVVVATGDAGAATFSATGSPSTAFVKSMVTPSVTLLLGGVPSGGDLTKEIVVDTFVLAGPSAFDAAGNAVGMKVGATARVSANDQAGNYSAVATFRIVY